MNPSPTMQQFIEQLAAKHGVDLSEPEQYLRLALPDDTIHLIIETTDDRQVMVGCYDNNGTEEADPSMRFAPDYPTGWLPVELLYSPQEWNAFRQQAGWSSQADEAALADLTEFWARRLLAQGWLLHGEKCQEPHRRLPGCQSTNHSVCYGELWRCAACGKTVCWAEGTADHPELCDDCWAKRYTSPPPSDAAAETHCAEQQSLVVTCDCTEFGGECGTWLELTSDGFLILEDKDGLRVSMMLPEWLEAAMRTALREFQQTQTNQAVSDEEAEEVQPPDAATLWRWVDECGQCTATDGCWVEPDGVCEHGHSSWLVVLGLI